MLSNNRYHTHSHHCAPYYYLSTSISHLSSSPCSTGWLDRWRCMHSTKIEIPGKKRNEQIIKPAGVASALSATFMIFSLSLDMHSLFCCKVFTKCMLSIFGRKSLKSAFVRSSKASSIGLVSPSNAYHVTCS